MNYDDLSRDALVEILKRRDAQARYGLHWEREAIDPERALNRDFVGFKLKPELSVGHGPWQNLLIEGDNYDALRLLATTHAGEFHLLYADVPYNTGNKDFVYNDRFVDKTHRFRHSLWLEFIYQRMVLAKQLLREDGANVYGVFPDGMGVAEREFAELLDTSAEVLWWHRNPSRKPESVALYRWSEGTAGFFPDFVVGVRERTEGGGVALSEVKGPHLQQYEKAKAGARHIDYGRVFMVGKTGATGGFRLWRLTTNHQLVDDGPFEAQRMRHS